MEFYIEIIISFMKSSYFKPCAKRRHHHHLDKTGEINPTYD